MPTMTDQMTPEKERAIRRLVDAFDNIPQDWAALVAEHKDGDECVAMPMWGTLFRVSNMDRGNIEKLLCHPVPSDAVGLIEFADDRGIEIEENEMQLLALAAADEDDDEVTEGLIEVVREQIIDAISMDMDEDFMLFSCGWQDVGNTGIIAREFDGELLLGINGAGYSFLDSHWQRLYDELGYSWHKQDE